MNTQRIAKTILASNPVFLDTETTGLDNDDQIIEIAIIDHNGKSLINKLIKATKASHPMALKTHGLSDEFIEKNGEEWDTVWPAVQKILSSEATCIYNTTFDVRMLKQTCEANNLTPYEPWSHDIMELANRHFIDHATWDTERSQFKRLSLAKCCELAGIVYQGNAHRAIVDCHATLDLLKHIANSQPKQASNDAALMIGATA